ncbi:MAG: adenylate kinase [Chloroflexota bacterium]|nr:MAG: adenylate kinase [Chloroflexota bacterium]
MRDFYVFLGPPGAGKGTQAKIVAARMGIPQISSGDIFRENLTNQTEMGILANKYIKVGELVPDDITISMVRGRISKADCARGAILDGFPRTPAQAEAFDGILKENGCRINKVPFIKVPENVLIERLSGRLTCRAEGHVFHKVNNPPREAGICDYDGSALYQREDDKPETVARRIRVYEQQTRPLIEYYMERGLLVEIDGDRSIDLVSAELTKILLDDEGNDV